MLLKKLELFGFKSFARKTSFDFSPGITAVVGPNGSGKSNIADAILWVFGEINAKTLRGEKMEDVIFSGTKERAQLNMAEVSLTFDNSSGQLDPEYNELSVTRRLYRTGDSYYMINETPCRRKDLLEKFMDTGVGKDAYSIISQGQINQILAARPVERRYIIEETAGISKYKSRKEEAARRLQNCKTDLVRISDILGELKERLDPLKKQAKKAKKYKKISEKLKETEVSFIVTKIENKRVNWNDLNKKAQEAESELNRANSDQNKLEAKTEQQKKELLNVEKELENKNEENTGIIEALEKGQADKRINEEKINSLKHKQEKSQEELGVIEKEITSKKKELNEAEKELKEVEELILKEETNYSKKKKELDLVVDKDGETSENFREELDSIISKKSSLKTRENVLKEKLEEKQDLIIKAKKEKEKKSKQVSEQEKKKDSLKSYQRQLNKTVESLSKKIEEDESRIKKLTSEEDEVRDEVNKIKGKLQEAKSKRKMLDELKNNYNVFSNGVREVLFMKERNEGNFPGVHGTVSQLISIPDGYETAIETALGRAFQNLVVSTAFEAVKLIEYLKQYNKGRVTCLPLDNLTPKSISARALKQAQNTKGFCGIAADLLNIQEEYKVVAYYLLGRILVVQDIDRALELAKVLNFSYRIVTVDGELILPGGAMTGGSSKGSNQNLIFSGKGEIDDLTGNIKELESELKIKEDKLNSILQKKDDVKLELKSTEDKKQSNEIAFKENEKELEEIMRESKRLQDEYELACENTKKQEEEKNNLIKTKEEIKVELKMIEAEESRLRGLQQEKEEEKSTMLDDKNKVESELNKIKVELARLSERKEHLYTSKNSFEKELFQLEDKKRKLTGELEEVKKDLEDTGLIRDKAIKKISELEEKQRELTNSLEGLRDKRDTIKENINNLETQKGKNRKEERELEKDLEKINFSKKELEKELKNMLDELYEKYQLSFEQAISYGTEQDKNVIKEKGFEVVEKKISKFKSQLNQLQPVDLSSLNEYNNLKNRIEFLQVQREDLLEAESSLEEIISEIDEIMKERFTKTAKKVDEAFNEVFKSLFRGGEATLKLTSPEDPLNTGVDVKVRPPNKKFQNLSLLSGGEKALTVIALLFSILKIKPTPFCILDEIDASLDDKNLGSYSNYLKELAKNTQFIVITHRKEMMQNCDTLYGLSMPEAGISKLISLDLKNKDGESA